MVMDVPSAIAVTVAALASAIVLAAAAKILFLTNYKFLLFYCYAIVYRFSDYTLFVL